MPRSYKKHCGSTFVCYGSDKPWRKQWHSAIRAKERDLLNLQLKYPEEDYCYPIPKEVSDLWDAPSDGGSCWMYSGFEHYYFEETHPRWPWIRTEILTREAAWKEWVTSLVGK
jgi:hypothetical protein